VRRRRVTPILSQRLREVRRRTSFSRVGSHPFLFGETG